MPDNAPPSGWYSDPTDPANMRWWDGAGWTDQVRPKEGPVTGAAGAPAFSGAASGAPPSNYLPFAILVTLFCCLPLGIYSIVKASQVNGLWQAGKTEEALEASKQAKLFVWISFGVGLAFIVIFGLLGAFSSDSTTNALAAIL